MKIMKLVIDRFRYGRGAVVGRLSQDIVDREGDVIDREFICNTVERMGGKLPEGEYRVREAKCPLLHRKMLFLRDDSGAGREMPPSHDVPGPAVCKRCRAVVKGGGRDRLRALRSIPCPMLQPGNGPFTLRRGGILVGEARQPGFVAQSQDTFLQLYDRVKKALGRKGEVTVAVEGRQC